MPVPLHSGQAPSSAAMMAARMNSGNRGIVLGTEGLKTRLGGFDFSGGIEKRFERFGVADSLFDDDCS